MIRKSDAPVWDDIKDLESLIATYVQFARLKQLYRQGWLQASVPKEQCETVAEHSLGVVMLTAVYGMRKEASDFDLKKALLMALFHDFGEIYAGDFTPQDQISPQEKHALELEAVQRVFDGASDAEDILLLWEEYETGTSVEARFVKELDRLEMGMQAAVYQRMGVLEHPEGFIASMMEAVESPVLRKAAGQLEEICKRG